MKKILLQSVTLPTWNNGNSIKDILIEENRFYRIADKITKEELDNAEIIDCKHFALIPPFYNAHTHCAMSLLRGYADDMELDKWLKNYIWPFESKLTPIDIEIGSRLAVLEMIKSGTVFFADMYWHREHTIKVVEEMGVRAAIGVTISDSLMSLDGINKNFEFLKNHTGESERVKLVVMPHSVYTVSENMLKKCIEIAHKENYLIHTHLSETIKEVEDCKKQYGRDPVELWKHLGGLDKNFIAAHCVHFSSQNIKDFKNASATIVLNPCSNLKLSSGIPPIKDFIDSSLKMCIGTDGCSSNNNLDMHEEMKLTALLAKLNGFVNYLPANDVFKMATFNAAKAYGLCNAGVIKEGALADGLLIRLDNEKMIPCHNFISNWVYSADSSCIDSVICNGRFIMKNQHVDGEEDIKKEALACVNKLLRK